MYDGYRIAEHYAEQLGGVPQTLGTFEKRPFLPMGQRLGCSRRELLRVAQTDRGVGRARRALRCLSGLHLTSAV